jgi:hypothetical protein
MQAVIQFTCFAAICFGAVPGWGAGQFCRERLSPSVEAKLLPVLKARETAADKNDWFDKQYEAEFDNLLKASDEDSQKARVALMDYYVGEHMGEELVCAVALDGPKVVPLLEHHERCDVIPPTSSYVRVRNLPLRRYALEMIKKGKVRESCTYE